MNQGVKCSWCTGPVHTQGFELRLVSVDPFGEQLAIGSDGHPKYLRRTCLACLEDVTDTILDERKDVPAVFASEDDDSARTCATCGSDILTGELHISLIRVRYFGDEREEEGYLCMSCAHRAAELIEDADLEDSRAPGCCRSCTDDHCWREDHETRDHPCGCWCHHPGQHREGEYDEHDDIDRDPVGFADPF